MSSPRIMIIIGQLGRGGAEQQLYHLLSSIDFSMTIVSLSPEGYWANPIRKLGHKVIELAHENNKLKRFLQLLSIVKDEKPDLLHLFLDSFSSGTYVRLLILLKRNIPLIIGVRGDPLLYPDWYRTLSRLTNRFVDFVVCNSFAAQNRLYELKITSKRVDITTIPNGIDFPLFAEAQYLKNDWVNRISDKSLIVGTVTHLTPVKNPFAIIRIAKYVQQTRNDVKFVIVGDGPLYDLCFAKIIDCELQETVYLLRERDDVPQILKSIDIFLLTSHKEGMPNALLEAMASGLPCLVTDVGDCARLVNEANAGYAFNVEDESGIAKSILRLASDHELRQNLGNAGQDYAAKFKIESFVHRYRDLYMQIINRQKEDVKCSASLEL